LPEVRSTQAERREPSNRYRSGWEIPCRGPEAPQRALPTKSAFSGRKVKGSGLQFALKVARTRPRRAPSTSSVAAWQARSKGSREPSMACGNESRRGPATSCVRAIGAEPNARRGARGTPPGTARRQAQRKIPKVNTRTTDCRKVRTADFPRSPSGPRSRLDPPWPACRSRRVYRSLRRTRATARGPARFAGGDRSRWRGAGLRRAQSNGLHSGKSRQTPLHCPLTQSSALVHGSPMREYGRQMPSIHREFTHSEVGRSQRSPK
jgi:hypothetical protein